jgi:hypothetical protein
LIPVDSSSIIIARVMALSAALDAEYAPPRQRSKPDPLRRAGARIGEFPRSQFVIAVVCGTVMRHAQGNGRGVRGLLTQSVSTRVCRLDISSCTANRAGKGCGSQPKSPGGTLPPQKGGRTSPRNSRCRGWSRYEMACPASTPSGDSHPARAQRVGSGGLCRNLNRDNAGRRASRSRWSPRGPETNGRNQEARITKTSQLIELLQQDEVSSGQLSQITGWQKHSGRGFISGTLRSGSTALAGSRQIAIGLHSG